MASKTPFALFTNDQGRTWTVRVLPVGARYGVHNMLTADAPTVEFYDTKFADDGAFARSGFGPLGQFVTRYNIATLLGIDGYGSGDGGLNMDGNVPVWTIDAETMKQVRTWLRERLAELTHLTPADTYSLYLGALDFLHNWGTSETIEEAGDYKDTSGVNPLTAWRVRVTEDEEDPSQFDDPSRVWEFGHEDIALAVVKVASDPDINIGEEIVKQFRAVVLAPSNDEATTELCQPDVIGFDAVVQVATIGEVIYG